MNTKIASIVLLAALCASTVVPQDRPPRRPPPPDEKQRYSIEQATSDQAQLHTSAFDGLAFLTGDFGYDTFLPPGKVSDYFGFQYMRDYSISTSLTGDSGEAFLNALSTTQRKLVTDLVEQQRSDLAEIVETRRAIATELRKFQKGETADKVRVLALSKRYGELDGEKSYLYATAFAKVGRTLSAQQKQTLAGLRRDDPSNPRGPFLYSSPIAIAKAENTDLFFAVR